MTGKKKPSAAVLYEIERHCNNYFNPRNDPNITERIYPPAFLDLAARIETFLKEQKEFAGNVTSISKTLGDTSLSLSFDPDYTTWQKLFSPELAIYKRVKFI